MANPDPEGERRATLTKYIPGQKTCLLDHRSEYIFRGITMLSLKSFSCISSEDVKKY